MTTVDFKNVVLESCDQRADSWAELVRARILSVHDLPAADAVYHQVCSVHLRAKKHIPKIHACQPENKKAKTGRPEDETKREAFLKVVQFLKENDDEQITVSNLTEKKSEFLGGEGVCGRTHMKTKLREHLCEDVIITNINGKANVVTFLTTAHYILQELHCKQETKKSQESEAMEIIKTAAKLISL